MGKYGKIMGKYGEMMGKSWENMGKSWGNDGKSMNILWMEEILHQLVYGLSPYNPIIYIVS